MIDYPRSLQPGFDDLWFCFRKNSWTTINADGPLSQSTSYRHLRRICGCDSGFLPVPGIWTHRPAALPNLVDQFVWYALREWQRRYCNWVYKHLRFTGLLQHIWSEWVKKYIFSWGLEMLPTQQRQSLPAHVLKGLMQRCLFKIRFVCFLKLFRRCFCCNTRIVHWVVLAHHPKWSWALSKYSWERSHWGLRTGAN